MNLAAFAEFRENTARQHQTTAWLAAWLAGEARQSTGRTLAELNDGYNQLKLELLLPPDVVSRLAEVERYVGLLVGLHISDPDSMETGTG